MALFKDYLKATRLQPMDMRGVHKMMLAELAKPRPMRPQVILVRNAQEAARMRALFTRLNGTGGRGAGPLYKVDID